MLRAVFFDMGGTLDGDGLHWLDRFVDLYARAGLAIPRDTIRTAFDSAEREAARDSAIQSAGLHDMVDRHVRWQFEALRRLGVAEVCDRIDTVTLERGIVNTFVNSVRDLAGVNRPLLASLRAKGWQLGVVSNGCGNVQALCDDFGYSPWLSIVVDSRCVGLFKPDPAIYQLAADRIRLPPSSIMMVGDSFERDVLPARSIGMKTAWLQGMPARHCPDPSSVDVSLHRLADLPDALDLLAAGSLPLSGAARVPAETRTWRE